MCPGYTLSATDLTWTDLGSRPANDRPIHGTLVYAWNFSSYLTENSPRAVGRPVFNDMQAENLRLL